MDSLSLAQALGSADCRAACMQDRKSTASAIRIPLGLQATESCAPLPGQAPISWGHPDPLLPRSRRLSTVQQKLAGNAMQPGRATVLCSMDGLPCIP